MPYRARRRMAINTKHHMKNRTRFCLLIAPPPPHSHASRRRMAREIAFGEAREVAGSGAQSRLPARHSKNLYDQCGARWPRSAHGGVTRAQQLPRFYTRHVTEPGYPAVTWSCHSSHWGRDRFPAPFFVVTGAQCDGQGRGLGIVRWSWCSLARPRAKKHRYAARARPNKNGVPYEAGWAPRRTASIFF